MAEKRIVGRVVQKHDIEANWLKATNFTPMQGEVIVYDIDENYDYERIKIGDGVHNVNDLLFYAGSWEDLTDRPFWSEGPTIVEWDGNTDGLTVSSDGTAYRVSDLKPSSTEIIGGKLTFRNGSVVEITSDIIEGEGYIVSIYYGTIYINTTNGSAYDASIGVTLSEPGIYFQKNSYNQIVSFSYGDEIIYQLDEKFIPDNIARISDIPEQVIDDVLSGTSTNPVQNKVVNEAIGNLNTLVGDTSVAEQISEATYTQSEVDDMVAAVKQFCLPKIRSITLTENNWVFSANYYYQDVPVGVCTPTSKVDLQPTYSQLATWQDDGLAFTTQSKDGIVRVWAIPDAPREDITVQISVQEVLEV
jgi:hypothetical protein